MPTTRPWPASSREVEDGGLFTKRGITNFLEGDFFRWYLDALSPELCERLRDLARGLAEFEPATPAIAPQAQRDLLKKLYQYLVPQDVRHHLGEYYTPDWLAEMVLDEAGYDGDARKRLLDPACGSGTFLVLAIQRAKRHAAASAASRPRRLPSGFSPTSGGSTLTLWQSSRRGPTTCLPWVI